MDVGIGLAQKIEKDMVYRGGMESYEGPPDLLSHYNMELFKITNILCTDATTPDVSIHTIYSMEHQTIIIRIGSKKDDSGHVKMPKLQWMKWYPADWINDTRQLSPEAKGCWMDILMLMWNSPKRGVWEGTNQEFARVTGIPWESAPSIIRELARDVATATFGDVGVTLENRRMVKEQTAYEFKLNRYKRYRERHKSDAQATDKTPPDFSRLLKITTTPGQVLDVESKATTSKQTEWFDKLWTLYPQKGRIGRKAALKHFLASVPDIETARRCEISMHKYKESKRVISGFVQNGATWFNNWQDWENYREEKDGTVYC